MKIIDNFIRQNLDSSTIVSPDDCQEHIDEVLAHHVAIGQQLERDFAAIQKKKQENKTEK